MTLCSRCILPNTYPGIEFDSAGVCNVCHHYERKWAQRDYKKWEKQMEEIFDRHRRRHGPYDCVVPISGGKDSTYVLYLCKRRYGLRPLAVHVQTGIQAPEAWTNTVNAVEQLGVDLAAAEAK